MRAIRRELQKNWALYLLVLIPLAVLIVFRYIPIYGVQIAFKNYQPARGIEGSDWVGLKYVAKFVTGYLFERIVGNTLRISMYSLATFPLSLMLALMLNHLASARYRRLIQMVSYAPYFLSTVVMVSLTLQFMDANSGLFNAFLGLMGVPPVNYMAKPEYFYSIYIWTGVWQGVGYSSIIYIAALAGVSPELHEAAIVDGATILQRIWHVDIPGVLPTFSILLVLRCGSIMNVDFERIYLMQNNLNSQVSEVISTYVYKQGLQSAIPQYSYASAIGLFTSVINMALLVLVNSVIKRLNGNSLW
ncbi:MAG: sugar ABC transporter permease [Clostridiales bacterium]|nr:sugar ABC transporter permease [Clostridiales bacterium]